MNGKPQTKLPPRIRIPESLHSRERQLDPFPYYRRMRESAPVAHDDQRDVWDVFRFEDVKRVITDYETFQRGEPTTDFLKQTMLTTEPPEHDRYRRPVEEYFTPGRLRESRPEYRTVVEEILEVALADGREMEFVSAFAFQFPSTVMANLLGVPPEDIETFKAWTGAVEGSPHELDPVEIEANIAERERAISALQDYFKRILADKRADPKDDVLSNLVTAEDGVLSFEEVVSMGMHLIVAGNITTKTLITNSLWTFVEKGIVDDLKSGTIPLDSAIQEVLRYRSPVQALPRETQEEVEVGGTTIPAGENVMAWIGSANRDPAVFDDPDAFVPTRTPNKHIAYGSGIHFCLGAPLANMESEIALSTFLERVEDVEIRDGEREPIVSSLFFGLEELPIEVRPAG